MFYGINVSIDGQYTISIDSLIPQILQDDDDEIKSLIKIVASSPNWKDNFMDKFLTCI